MSYAFRATPNLTKASEPIPGREAEMSLSKSGAVTFVATDWMFLKRGLITGTSNGTFYADRNSLTYDWESSLKACLDQDPSRVAKEVLYASEGRAISNSTCLYALVIISIHPKGKEIFKEIFNKVVRTGSHLHEFMSYAKPTRGMGSVIHRALNGWLNGRSVDQLAYQMLKYPQRYGFSFADELRLLKPVVSGDRSDLYGYVVGKKTMPTVEDTGVSKTSDLDIVYWYEWLKANPTKAVEAIRGGRLTHEMVAPVASMSQDVWQELFESMPVTATLRNLANLTTQGVLCPKNRKNLARLEGIFLDKAVLKKALVHPLDLLKAWKTYASGGLYGRSSKTYVPVQRIVDILEESLTLSFETIERTDKVFLHGLDISGSMGSNISSSGGTLPIRYCEVAALMALVTARAEPNYYIKGFSSNVIDLKISARSSFGDATREVVKNNFGGTDAGKVYQWAITEKVFVDTFVFWTDGENWAGYHPSQLLKKYRGAVNPEAKAIYVTLTPGPVTLVDPKDPQSFDLAGFDPSIPKMVQMISSGELS